MVLSVLQSEVVSEESKYNLDPTSLILMAYNFGYPPGSSDHPDSNQASSCGVDQ